MPVEIKELVIRAVVDFDTGRGREPGEAGEGQGAAVDQAALVQVCVRQVLRVLEKRPER
jgi:Family of unknown function (DUF5908)